MNTISHAAKHLSPRSEYFPPGSTHFKLWNIDNAQTTYTHFNYNIISVCIYSTQNTHTSSQISKKQSKLNEIPGMLVHKVISAMVGMLVGAHVNPQRQCSLLTVSVCSDANNISWGKLFFGQLPVTGDDTSANAKLNIIYIETKKTTNHRLSCGSDSTKPSPLSVLVLKNSS